MNAQCTNVLMNAYLLYLLYIRGVHLHIRTSVHLRIKHFTFAHP